jgi:predicted metal-dependent HD superfamily phosphohydrolase
MTRAAVSHIHNVTVDVCLGHYVIKHAESVNAQIIIRGLRNFKDLMDEQTLAEENRKICPHIETLWVPCLPHLMHVSSSMVKSHVGVDPNWSEHVARSAPDIVVAKLKEKSVLRKARAHWAKLMSKLGNPVGSDSILTDLLARYGEVLRAYHNLEHIVTMLDELEQLLPDAAPAIALAIWFHDAVYDPKGKENEAHSAKLVRDCVKQMGLSDTLGHHVGELILATQHTFAPTEHAAKILVDLDLMILGKPKNEFDAYETGIRTEYSFVPQPDFNGARSNILKTFLDRPSIYSTSLFRDRYEGAARENLARSIRQLHK